MSFYVVGFFFLISFTKMKRESYGEDIGDTETDRSDFSDDEDGYEDSFIDDDANLEVSPPSPISNEGTFKYNVNPSTC